jgi:chloride channel 3/4/5
LELVIVPYSAMAADEEHAIERTPLLFRDRRLSSVAHDTDASSIISSHVSKEEQALGETAVGERLPYNDYTTIDWLHDLVGREQVYSCASC